VCSVAEHLCGVLICPCCFESVCVQVMTDHGVSAAGDSCFVDFLCVFLCCVWLTCVMFSLGDQETFFKYSQDFHVSFGFCVAIVRVSYA